MPSSTFPISSVSSSLSSPVPSRHNQPADYHPKSDPTPAIWTKTIRSPVTSNGFHSSAGGPPDHIPTLKEATALRDLPSGRQLHAALIKFGHHPSPVAVANALITMYSKCGDLASAFKLFDRITNRDQVSWNSMIAALCMFQEWELALEAVWLMQEDHVVPNSFTLVSAALACSNLNGINILRLGKQVHGYGLRAGIYRDDGNTTFAYNALIAMYGKLGRVDDSTALFDRYDDGRDTVMWNTIISTLVQNNWFGEALSLLHRMVLSGIKPDGVTLSSVIPACSHMDLLDSGREIHAYALRNDDLFANSFVASALVDMYCKLGEVVKGRLIFGEISECRRRLGLWNAMISGYARNGLDEEALELFIEMEADAGLCPDTTTLASVLPCCVRSEAFHRKESIHGYAVKRGLECDRYVQNALMDMYSRVGKIELSLKIFNSMVDKDVVSWNTMIVGFTVCGLFSEALNLLCEMQRMTNKHKDTTTSNYTKPDNITLMTVLPCCASLAALGKGKEIHGHAIRNALDSDVSVGSALVDMYAKCGCLSQSRRVFDGMPERNVITWNTLIMACAMHGRGEEALRLFEEMVSVGEVKPNEATFIAVFVACSHSGMVSQGLGLFCRMKEKHGIEPTPDHYVCVVDLLGRAGQLEEAYRLIATMDSGPCQVAALRSLLGACRVGQNIQLGEVVANHLFRLEPDVASHYVLIFNMYAVAGLWEEAIEVRRKMREMGVSKEAGCSWIEVGDKVHKFMVGDSLHPQSPQLHSYLETLWEGMRKEDYMPDTSRLLQNHDEEMLL